MSIKNKAFTYFVVLLLTAPFSLLAQFNNNTSSPYSRYGLGELHPYSFGRTAAMGGASLASRYKLQVNSANPASYTATDSLNFLFEFGLHGTMAKYQTETDQMKNTDINVQYFSMGFRINSKIATALGVKPFSDVGYQVSTIGDLETGQYQASYYGTGTITKAFVGVAITPFPNLSIGTNANYLFGNLSRNVNIAFSDAGAYSLSRVSTVRLRDFSFDFGAQYILPVKNERTLVLGAVFENQPTYTGFTSDLIVKQMSVYNSTTRQTVSDADTLINLEETRSKVQFPNTLGFGVSISKRDVYEINADYYYQGWSETSFLGDPESILSNRNSFAIGGEWIPERFSIRHAWKRVAYRAGFKYEQTYLKLGGQRINNFGMTFGFGIPLYRSQSTLNIGGEIGKTGTTANNLIKENYFKFNLSVSLHDLWFMQRKID